MKNSQNPAIRLHEILLRAKKIEGTLIKVIDSSEGKRRVLPDSIDVWTKVFNLQDAARDRVPEQELIKCFYQLLALADDTEEILNTIEDVEVEKYLFSLFYVRKYIPLTRLFQPNDVTLDEFHLRSLQFTSDLLARYYTEKQIDEELLQSILEETYKLYNEIAASQIEQDLKIILLDLLQTIRHSIHNYKVRGVKSLKEAVTDLIGKTYLNQGILKNSDSEEAKKVWELSSKFFSVYAFAADSAQLLDAAGKILPLLPAIVSQIK